MGTGGRLFPGGTGGTAGDGLRHVGHWEAIGREHGAVFGSIRPASTMVEVSGLVDLGMLVEIEADAFIADPTA